MMPFQSALLPLMCCLALVVGQPALPCSPAFCRLPDCRCADFTIPGRLAPSQTPQIVTIAIDDAIRVQDYDTFYSQFLNQHRNPNGCPIQATFFVSHDNTDYSLMEEIVSRGHEIADHSVTHREPPTWWDEADVGNLTREIVDMKTICERWGNVPAGAIRGFRVPYLSISENELKALHNENFLYEASMPSRDLYWPFTLDYQSPLCDSPAVCPRESYPGLWIIPTPILDQPRGGPVCGMLDSCIIPQNRQEWFNFLRDNFLRYYQGENKAPFGLYTHASWFYFPGDRLAALNDFLTFLETLDDVYVVSHQKLLEWVRNPTPLSEINNFEPWQCPSPPPPRCAYQSSTRCTYDLQQLQVHRSCDTECPVVQPALGNPLGLDPAVLATLSSGSEVAPTATSSVEVVTSTDIQESSSIIVSSSTLSSVVPSETASETSESVGQSTSVEPAVDSMSVVVDSTSVDPAVDSTSVDPAVDSTSVLDPAVDSTSVDPAVDSTSVDPAVDSTSVDPAVDSTSVDLVVDSTSQEPVVESSSFVPTPTSVSVVVASSSQLVQPSASVPELTTSTPQPPQPTNLTPTGATGGLGSSQTGGVDTTIVSAVGAAVGGVVLLSIGVVVVVSVHT